MAKRIFFEVIAIIAMCVCLMGYAMTVYAADGIEENGGDKKSKNDNDGDNGKDGIVYEDSGRGDVSEKLPPHEKTIMDSSVYFDENLSIAELYSNIDPLTTKYKAVEYGEVTEKPMLAAYTDDPNWGDHRQFARMCPNVSGAALTPGDTVAKITLTPDTEYYLMEYLVNTAAEDTEIKGLKLYIDFPTHMNVDETNYIYAYLESENDAGGSRVCYIEMTTDREIWLDSLNGMFFGYMTNVTKQTTSKTSPSVWSQEAEYGAKVDDSGQLRSLLSVEWPEANPLAGGENNGYFVNTVITTHSESPFSQVMVLDDEAFEAAIADDPDMPQEVIEGDVKDADYESTPTNMTARKIIAVLGSIITACGIFLIVTSKRS